MQNASFYPEIDKSVALSKNYSLKAIRSLSHLSEKTSRFLGTPVDQIKSKLELLKESKLNCSFYSVNTSLVRALYEQKNIDKFKATLLSFSSKEKSEFYFDKTSINNLSDFEWSMEFANDTVADANKINEAETSVMSPLSRETFELNKQYVMRALEVLSGSSANLYAKEVSLYVSNIILFDGLGISGGSSTRTMGAVFIRIPNGMQKTCNIPLGELTLTKLTPLLYYIEQIVHEAAHLHLDQIMEFDALILNDPRARYQSPIRVDPRPMRGVYHATFVLARLIDMYRKLDSLVSPKDIQAKNNRIQVVRKALERGVNTIKQYAELTQEGAALLKEMEAMVYGE